MAITVYNAPSLQHNLAAQAAYAAYTVNQGGSPNWAGLTGTQQSGWLLAVEAVRKQAFLDDPHSGGPN